MTIVINQAELPASEIGWEFEGFRYGDPNASFLIIEAPPGTGPRLHSHPYPEIFIVQAGQATFILGDSTLQASGGQIIVAPRMCLTNSSTLVPSPYAKLIFTPTRASSPLGSKIRPPAKIK